MLANCAWSSPANPIQLIDSEALVPPFLTVTVCFALTDPTTNPDLPWTMTPYVQFDYYKNPEIVKEKDIGGDNEAGIAEDGRFIKLTIGGIVRPVPQVAVKLDGSIHFQKIAGQETNYPELRLSFAYYWEIQG